MCSGDSLTLMRPSEIEVLVTGSRESTVNLALVRENSIYEDGLTADDPLVL